MCEKLDFEKAMARLEEIVSQLEGGEGSLEEAMGLFEEGAALSAQCYETLRAAERRVEELTAKKEEDDHGEQ